MVKVELGQLKHTDIVGRMENNDNDPISISAVEENYVPNSRVIEYPDDTSSLVESQGIKSFVNSSIQNMAAFYITDKDGHTFESYSALSNTTSSDMYCGGEQWTPQRNDYCIVRKDETQVEQVGGQWNATASINGQGVHHAKYIFNREIGGYIYEWLRDSSSSPLMPNMLQYNRNIELSNVRWQDSGGIYGWKDCGVLSGLNPLNGDDLGSFHWVSPNGSVYDFVFTQQSADKIPTSRYIYNPGSTYQSVDYDPSNWQFQYTINDSGFTQEQLNAINSGISKSKVDKLNALPTQEELQAEFDNKLNRTDYLSSINDNEISNYVNADTNQIRIGVNSANKGNSFAIGNSAKVYGTANTFGTAIGDYTTIAGSRNAEAIGRDAKVTNADYACQIGKGENTNISSLQFLDTTVVDSTGRIPNNSLELKQVNGVLSSDGNGNIVSANITFTETDPVFTDWMENSSKIHVGELSGSATHSEISLGAKSKCTGSNSVAIGYQSICHSSGSAQLGPGVNISDNTLQFRNTRLVDSNGLVPTSSLELKTINGILSSDGNGNIVSAEISIYDNFGRWLSADGTHIGMNSENTGVRSIAIGSSSNSTSYDSIALGSVAEAKANYSIAIGNQSKASKFKSIAIGNNVVSEGEHSIAIGNDIDQSTKTQAKADFAIQMGVGVNSNPNTFNVFEKTILDYDQDTSSHYIPNGSLELASTSGILSSDGNGNITGYDITTNICDDYNAKIAAEVARAKSSEDELSATLSVIDEELSSKVYVSSEIGSGYTNLSVIKLTVEDYMELVTEDKCLSNVLYITSADYEECYGRVLSNVTMTDDDVESEAATKHYVDTRTSSVEGINRMTLTFKFQSEGGTEDISSINIAYFES